MESTRLITKAMMASEVPVVVYVSPTGARAASAGVFITYASHVAAMSPGTNIGAAHPVNIGGGADSANTMIEKATNDAVAKIRAVAEIRGRNVAWAEEAVRKSVSITEKEALAQNVVEFVVPNLDSLLKFIDGREVELVNRKAKLATAGAKIIRKEMNWRHKLLDRISDPNIAYILMLLGIYGMFFELSNPGAILPGVLGGIFLILALYSLQTLPVNWAGALLILFAIILFILEIKVTSFGILTIGGIAAMFLGSMMLFKEPQTDFEPVVSLSKQLVIAATLATAAFFLLTVGMVVKGQRRPAETGAEGMIGEIGRALTAIAPQGKVRVHGEIWKARSGAPIDAGAEVRVVSVKDLEVTVEKV
jgi:membrane-bound serine protease (ClpP class)